MIEFSILIFFFFSSRRRHTRLTCDWSSDVCSSDLEPRMREARRWFSASFKVKTLEQLNALCPSGSEPNASYRMVTTHWEMVASFMTSGVLSQELFFESGRELLFCWERMRD